MQSSMELFCSNHETSCIKYQTKNLREISMQQSKSDKETRVQEKSKIKANRFSQFVLLSKELIPNFWFLFWEYLKASPPNLQVKLNFEELNGITIHLGKIWNLFKNIRAISLQKKTI